MAHFGGTTLLTDFYECSDSVFLPETILEQTFSECLASIGLQIKGFQFISSPKSCHISFFTDRIQAAIHYQKTQHLAVVDLFTSGTGRDCGPLVQALRKTLRSRYYYTMEVKRGIYPERKNDNPPTPAAEANP